MTGESAVSARQVFSSPVLFLAFGFGSGLSPRAPGTAGTLAALPLYWLLSQAPESVYLFSLAVISIGGVWICQRASTMLGVHDHGGIVLDEIAGYLLTMLTVPVHWTWMLAGFVLFRVLDIWKPWPVSWVDRRLGGGLGIMLDDLLAGGIAALLLLLLQALL